MNQEKIIEKLMKKAKAIGKVEISSEHIIELDIEAFYDTYRLQKDDLYYKDNKIYKKSLQGWYMVKIGVDLKELEQNLKEIEQRVRDLGKWTHDIKSYIDVEFERINNEIQKLKEKK